MNTITRRRRSNCNDCKAFDPVAELCVLDYKIKKGEAGTITPIAVYKPAEPCPKPRTKPELYRLLR